MHAVQLLELSGWTFIQMFSESINIDDDSHIKASDVAWRAPVSNAKI